MQNFSHINVRIVTKEMLHALFIAASMHLPKLTPKKAKNTFLKDTMEFTRNHAKPTTAGAATVIDRPLTSSDECTANSSSLCTHTYAGHLKLLAQSG